MIVDMKIFLNCSSIILVVAFLLSHSLSYAEDALNPCRCLQENSMQLAEANMNRVQTRRASFHVPLGASPCKADSPDSEEWQWVRGENVITYARSPFSDESNVSGEGSCEKEFPFGKAVLSIKKQPYKVVARISDISTSPYGYHIISTSSDQAADACVLMNHVLESFSFINDWSEIEILHIDEGRSYFVYENEVGVRRVAGLGDYVTRDHGVVIEILSDHVVVREMVSISGKPSLEGGERVLRTLRFDSAEQAR